MAIYPAAQCAAFWLGFHDYAKRSPLLVPNAADPKRAEAFRAVARRLAPNRTAEVDQTIHNQRAEMALLTEAVIFSGDAQSRKLFETLTRVCADLGATHPETQALR